MSNINRNHLIAQNSILLSIRLVVVILITFYTTRVLLNLLGIEDYGIYSVVCGFVSMFAFLNTSMSNGIQRFYNVELGRGDKERLNNIYITSVYIQFLLVLFVILIAETLGLWFLRNKMVIPENRAFAAEFVFQASIINFVFMILQAPFVGAVLAHERMNFFALMSIFDALMKLIIVFAASLFEMDNLIIYGCLFSTISLLDFLFYFVYAKKEFEEIHFKRIWNKQLFMSMMSFSSWNLFGSFSGMIKEQGINIVLNLFGGPVVNAATGIANQINGGLQNFVYNLSISVRPQVIQSFAIGNTERTMHLTYSISKLSNCFLYLISMPILCEIDTVLRIWLGDNVANHTNAFVIIIVLVSYVNNLNMAVSGVVHASGKMKYYQIGNSFINFLCLPAAYYLLCMHYHLEFALIMVLLFVVISQVFSLVYLKTIVQYSIYNYVTKVIKPIALVVMLTAYIPFALKYIFHDDLTRLFINTLVFIPFCIFIIYKFALETSEKELTSTFLKSILIRYNLKKK